jgi:hypothetical protein
VAFNKSEALEKILTYCTDTVHQRKNYSITTGKTTRT